MRIVHDYRVARRGGGTAIAIGNFDGVHLGHRVILDGAIAAARAHGVEPVVVTFEPHPTRILAPERASPLLTGLDRRLDLLAATGMSCAVVQTFDRRLSAMTPREFVSEVLVGLRAREVHVGGNFHFGKDRAGNGAVLEALGAELGFVAKVVDAVEIDGATVSSSRIRTALAAGDLALAERLLGRPFDLDGLVVEGDRRGRLLGFPTANLRSPVEALPRDGVYAVRVRVLDDRADDAGEGWLDGVMNIGVRPTFSAGRSIEVHLLDTTRELYGATLRVQCVARLRDEMKFDGVEALRARIGRDVTAARAALETAR